MSEANSQERKGGAAVAERPASERSVEDLHQNWSAENTVAGERKTKSTMTKIRDFRLEFGPSNKDILSFTNQLAVMVRAGISLQDALEAIGGHVHA